MFKKPCLVSHFNGGGKKCPQPRLMIYWNSEISGGESRNRDLEGLSYISNNVLNGSLAPLEL